MAMETPTTSELLKIMRAELAVLDPDVPVARVTPEAEIASLNLESVTMLSLVAELEERFGIRVPERALTQLSTVEDLVLVIQHHVRAKGLEGERQI